MHVLGEPLMSDPAKRRGIEVSKFRVTRTDGSSRRGGRHHNCGYFVLDLQHDKFAPAALKAYAEACDKDYPLLARDLRVMLAGGFFVGHPSQTKVTR